MKSESRVIQNSEFRMQTQPNVREPRCLHFAFCILHSVVVLLAAASIATAAETLLLEAAERGDRAAALRVLAKGADPNVPGPDGTTAIMWAARAR